MIDRKRAGQFWSKLDHVNKWYHKSKKWEDLVAEPKFLTRNNQWKTQISLGVICLLIFHDNPTLVGIWTCYHKICC